MNTTAQMSDLKPRDQAIKAITHVLARIADNPTIAYHCGHGSQTYALLTEARANLTNISIIQTQDMFPPAQPLKLDPGQMRNCPFCGGNYLNVQIDSCYASVYCSDCRISGPRVDNERAKDPTLPAIDAWNKRAKQRL